MNAPNTRLVARLLGTGNVLVIHRFTLELVGGDHMAALLLEQLLYWTERTNNSDGWIVKTYAEWETELGMTRKVIVRAARILKPFGVETAVRRSPFHKMQPVIHYRVKTDVLEQAIEQRMGIAQRAISEIAQRETSEIAQTDISEVAQKGTSITETTTQTTTSSGDAPTERQEVTQTVTRWYHDKAGDLMPQYLRKELDMLADDFTLAQVQRAILSIGDRKPQKPLAYLRTVVADMVREEANRPLPVITPAAERAALEAAERARLEWDRERAAEWAQAAGGEL